MKIKSNFLGVYVLNKEKTSWDLEFISTKLFLEKEYHNLEDLPLLDNFLCYPSGDFYKMVWRKENKFSDSVEITESEKKKIEKIGKSDKVETLIEDFPVENNNTCQPA